VAGVGRPGAAEQLPQQQGLQRPVHNQARVPLLGGVAGVVVDAVPVVGQRGEPEQQHVVHLQLQAVRCGRGCRHGLLGRCSTAQRRARRAVDDVLLVDHRHPAGLLDGVPHGDEGERPGAALLLRRARHLRGAGRGYAEPQGRMLDGAPAGEHTQPTGAGRRRDPECRVAVGAEVCAGAPLKQVDPVPGRRQEVPGRGDVEETRQGLRGLGADQLRPGDDRTVTGVGVGRGAHRSLLGASAEPASSARMASVCCPTAGTAPSPPPGRPLSRAATGTGRRRPG